MSVDEDPLVARPPTEVPLRDAPLVRVIAQIRFPEVLSVGQREFVAPLQEALRATYPVLRQEHTEPGLLAPARPAAEPSIVWRFSDPEGGWRVSLTPVFLALETTRYLSRSDFLGRLRLVAQALDEHVEPAQVDRLGVRYIDRITGVAVDEISTLVRPEVQGIVGGAAAAHAAYTLSETLFDLSRDRVIARWGCLPAEATVDPALEPASEKSWILDLDMFSAEPMPFDVDRIVAETERYAERIYTIFRWAVTSRFLQRYGGTP